MFYGRQLDGIVRALIQSRKGRVANGRTASPQRRLSLLINRSYYSIFHAIRAVNALDGFDSSKHSGVISHFNQEYVKTGLFEKEVSKIIRNASEMREQADYEDFYETSQEEAVDVFEQATRFISVVEVYLREKAILSFVHVV